MTTRTVREPDLEGTGRPTTVTVRARPGGVTLRVEGLLDEPAAHALVDAVRVASEAGDDVAVEVGPLENVTSGAIRELAVCTRLGAVLHFVGPSATRSS
jgi:hypothetical protein